VPEVPSTGVLSQTASENCLDRVRANFADLGRGMQPSAMEGTYPTIDAREQSPPEFRQEKSARPKWYISYAWGEDKTPEGKAREKVVDDLCVIALADGYQILRDKEVLGLGAIPCP